MAEASIKKHWDEFRRNPTVKKAASASWHTFRTGVVMTAAVIGLPFVYINTGGFKKMPAKVPELINTNFDAEGGIDKLTAQTKIRLIDAIRCYSDRAIGIQGSALAFTEEECNLACGRLQNYALMEQCDDKLTGFYGAMYRDTVDKKNILVLSGMNYSSGIGPLLVDASSAILSAAGGWVPQLHTSLDFVRKMDKKYKIDVISGHSLGGYLTLFAKGTGATKAEAWVFDCAGVQNITVDKCMQISGLNRDEVIKNFKDKMYSFGVTGNLYNAIGTQPNISLTIDNIPPFYGSLFPDKHIITDDVAKEINSTQKFIPKDNNMQSGARDTVGGILLLAALLVTRREQKKMYNWTKENTPKAYYWSKDKVKKATDNLPRRDPDLREIYKKLARSDESTREMLMRKWQERISNKKAETKDVSNDDISETKAFPVIVLQSRDTVTEMFVNGLQQTKNSIAKTARSMIS